MRRYTLIFMEQRMGVARLTPVEGEDGSVSFTAPDDEAALAHINQQFIGPLQRCVRGELSSLRMVPDSKAAGGTRFVDDSHANPHFQDSYVKYNHATKLAELDFDSTRTALMGASRFTAG
jgi:hypothetical protein